MRVLQLEHKRMKVILTMGWSLFWTVLAAVSWASDLPDHIRNKIKMEYPGAVIEEARFEKWKEKAVYEISKQP